MDSILPRPLLAGMITGLMVATAATAQEATTKTQGELLKTIDSIDSIGSPPKRPTLGLEGTPVAQTMSEAPKKKAPGETIIRADEATFDQKKRVAVFIKNVDVKHPEFTVTCDRLTAYLKPEGTTPPADPPPVAKPQNGGAAAPKAGDGGLDHVIAEANPGKLVKVIQQKTGEDGAISYNIGNARKVTFDEKTGDIVLTGRPSVQQGINLQVADEDGTVMTLNRDGNMHTKGRHHSVIKDSANIENGR